MQKKKIILFFLGIMLIAGFFLLPRNQQWAGVVFSYWNDFQFQKNKMDRETRMRRRFGGEYIYSKAIADSFQKKGIKNNVLVLMPPTGFFKKMGFDYHVPEPAVFYYYTGLKTIWANSKDAINAGWYARINNGKFVIDSVTDRKKLQDTIAAFQKLGISL